MGNFSLEGFVKTYVGSMLEAVQKDEEISSDDFDNLVFQYVSERTGLPTENVKYLHHAFYWSFFSGISSPFIFFNPKGREAKTQIRLRNGIPEEGALVLQVLREYREWFEARLKNLGQSQN